MLAHLSVLFCIHSMAAVNVAGEFECFGLRAFGSVCLLLRRVLDPGCGRKDHCT